MALAQLLLTDIGPKVNAQGGKLGNALQAASFVINQVIMRLLPDNEAEKDENALSTSRCSASVSSTPINRLLRWPCAGQWGGDCTTCRANQ
jgi:hypothetical protein